MISDGNPRNPHGIPLVFVGARVVMRRNVRMHGIPQKVGILEFAMLSAGVHSRRAFSKVGGIAFGQSSRGGVRIPWSIPSVFHFSKARNRSRK